jgi:hypothetical protein
MNAAVRAQGRSSAAGTNEVITRPMSELSVDPTTDPSRAELPHRSHAMNLLHEDLARAQIAERLEEAARQRRIHRIQAARRLSRRAERASQRARRALALASLHA